MVAFFVTRCAKNARYEGLLTQQIDAALKYLTQLAAHDGRALGQGAQLLARDHAG